MKLLQVILLFLPILAYAEHNPEQDSLLNLIEKTEVILQKL